MRREKCLVIEKTAAHEIPNVRVLPLGAVVTHKVRLINDLSFDLFNRAKKEGLNAETDVNSVPPSLCREWDAKIRASKGGKLSIPFHTVVYVDDHGLIRAQQPDEDKSALVVSASLASDYVRLFRPGEPGEIPILAPKKNSNWNTNLDFLGSVINSHTLEISVTTKKAQAIKMALVDDWPRCKRRVTAQEMFSFAGKLWNLTYVIRAGKYFVCRLLRLTDLHTRTGKNRQSRSVELGREFHDDLNFWRWAIDHELLTARSH